MAQSLISSANSFIVRSGVSEVNGRTELNRSRPFSFSSSKVGKRQWNKHSAGLVLACLGDSRRSSPPAATGAATASTSVKREYPPAVWNDDVINSLISTYKSADVAEQEKRAETLIAEIKGMFKSMGDGETNPSAYDTAWVARIPAVDGSSRPQFPQTLQWILQNQLSDGSWGEELCFLTYDRALATLACVITLSLWNTGEEQVKKGVEFIKKHAERMEGEADNHRPSGFEIVFISMLNEAKTLGLDLPYELPFFKQINEMRETKLKKIPLNVVHTIPTTILYSLEGLQEIIDWDKIMKLQSKDGSFLSSPASTAAVFMRTGDKKCLDFLSFVLNKFQDHAPCHYPLDLFERLWAVDTCQRLGIDRHFKDEIKETLDYVYSYWNDRGIGWARENAVGDIDDTVMALRLLRLSGYNVSSDALKTFRDENGEFFCFMGQTQRGVTDMLNVHRCSQVAYPGETVMEEAKQCTLRYLTNALDNVGAFDKWALKKDLQGEVEYVLRYPWHRSLPRLEAKNYVEQYGANDVWLGKSMYLMYNVSNPKYLELAQIDFNKVQSVHQKEIQELQRWWKSSGFTKLNFTPERVVEIYFGVAATMFEPELATLRAVYTKTSIISVILSDLYEAQGSTDNIMLFSEAVKRWDMSLVDRMSEEMKICFKGLYGTVNEIAEEGRKRQGRDVLPYLRNLWEVQLDSYTKEAKIAQAKYMPSFQEYMENAKVSMGLATIVLTTALFTGDLLSDETLSKMGYDSKFIQLMVSTGRLVCDTKTYQEKQERGLPSAIQCYMKDHPETSEKEALDHIYSLLQNSLLELNWELVNNREMPETCRRLVFNTSRIMQLFFMERDGFIMSHLEMQQLVRKCLFDPVAV
uniref:Copalyl diphosphate synthase-like 1 n=1 Tax=Chamaecyparis formosensis TaxID=187461 RepID=A0A8F2PW31_CHAFM|nr:copalyl diphosphate synthase-like 1 [Chamaecyparis formosensis]